MAEREGVPKVGVDFGTLVFATLSNDRKGGPWIFLDYDNFELVPTDRVDFQISVDCSTRQGEEMHEYGDPEQRLPWGLFCIGESLERRHVSHAACRSQYQHPLVSRSKSCETSPLFVA